MPAMPTSLGSSSPARDMKRCRRALCWAPCARPRGAGRPLGGVGEHGVGLPVPLLGDRDADASVLRNLARRLGADGVVDLPAARPQDADDCHPAFAGVLARGARGVTVFFTGLSGSGKSTLARALAARLEDAGRTVTLL